jgi:hypothetical protein
MGSPKKSFQTVGHEEPLEKENYKTDLQVLGVSNGRLVASRHKKPRRRPWD